MCNSTSRHCAAGLLVATLLEITGGEAVAQTQPAPAAVPAAANAQGELAPPPSVASPNAYASPAGTSNAQPAPNLAPAPQYVMPAPVSGTPIYNNGEGAPSTRSVASTPSHNTGFHLAVGMGLSGAGYPGIASQFKIGATITPEFRVYYYALNHWYKVPNNNTSFLRDTWRIIAINGVGIDYFFHPRVGGRLALGLGGNLPADLGSGRKGIGLAYAMGLTFEMLGGPNRLSVDPMLLVANYSNKEFCSGTTCDYWISSLATTVSVNYVFN
jgi:hypothetical protein